MPNPNVGLCVGLGETFTFWSTSMDSAWSSSGEVCSSNGGRILTCQCPTGQTPTLPTNVDNCTSNGTISWGCKFTGGTDATKAAYCLTKERSDTTIPCSICGCHASSSSWTSAGSNRVSRFAYAPKDETTLGLACGMTTTTEYGCAAGYYQSGGSGASMTCTRCPASGGAYGTNVDGSTGVTTCYIPANTTFTETTGAGVFTLSCSYSN